MNQAPTRAAIVVALLMAGLSVKAANQRPPARDEPAVAYRCESTGQPVVTYQSHPCDHGKAIHARDVRTELQRTSSAKVHQTESQLARRLERSRIKSERLSASKQAMSLSPPAPAREAVEAKAKAKPKTMKSKRPFTARAPKSLNAGQAQTLENHHSNQDPKQADAKH